MNWRVIPSLAALLAAFISCTWLCGCGITESEEPAAGALTVSVWDTTAGQSLPGAAIFVDGTARQECTPATICGLSEGLHSVTVVPPALDYPSIDTTVNITPPDTQTVTLLAGASTEPGYLHIVTTPADAAVHIDFRPGDHASGSVLPILPGEHLVSAWLDDHAVPEPGFVVATVRAADTTTVRLTLTEEPSGIGNGQLAPNLVLTGDLGNEYSLAQYRGAVLLLNFAGFDCDPCRDELPDIQRVCEQRFEDGFRVLVINVGWYNDGPDDFARIREDLHLTMPLLFADTPGGAATTTYNIAAAPTNVLIDRRGIIRYRLGAVTEAQLDELIQPLLSD
ncbi:TlpA family protein disulfide reductase [bacterium]|nr:TlpA family protein disulfide reductase [bacterium]